MSNEKMNMLRAVCLPAPYQNVIGYFVSKDGCVWSEKRKKFLKPATTPHGYYVVGLSVGGKKSRTFFIHRLVAEAFLPPDINKPRINHKNGIKTDNRIENLERCTSRENNLHAYETGLKPCGEKHKSAKLTDIEISFILDSSMKVSELAKQLGVCESHIYYIKRGKHRRHQWAAHKELKALKDNQ